jgi:trehalose synthase
MSRARELFEGRVFWHVNSTARGGGVAEMLQSLVSYFRGAGVDCRWVVIEGNERFFRVTKRVHNNLHGELGDGGGLGAAERQPYEATLESSAQDLVSLLRPGDVVFLHDPQTAGLAKRVRETGAAVVWRCHVGLDTPNDLARRAWDFLRAYVTRPSMLC